jgi:hypothetical protein
METYFAVLLIIGIVLIIHIIILQLIINKNEGKFLNMVKSKI